MVGGREDTNDKGKKALQDCIVVTQQIEEVNTTLNVMDSGLSGANRESLEELRHTILEVSQQFDVAPNNEPTGQKPDRGTLSGTNLDGYRPPTQEEQKHQSELVRTKGSLQNMLNILVSKDCERDDNLKSAINGAVNALKEVNKIQNGYEVTKYALDQKAARDNPDTQ